MTWIGMVPGTLALVLMVFAPGALLLRLGGVRGLLALAGAPALSLAFYAVAGIGLDRAGIAWAWPALLACLAGVAGLAGLAGWWIRADARRRFRTGGHSRPAGLWAAKYTRTPGAAWLTLALAGSAALMAYPIARGMVTPDALLQQWDAVFHANGIQAIRETGNASTFGAMQPMFGAVGTDYYYPAVWHGIVALAPGFGTVAAAANASTFVFGIVVWLVGLAGLGHVLFVGRAHARAKVLLTVVLGASFGAFPFVILATLAQWPFGAGIALIPGTTALVVASLTGVPLGIRFATPARLTVTGMILGMAVVGVGLTHGSAFFSLLLVIVPFAVAAVIRAVGRRWAAGRRRRIIWTGSIVGVLGLAGAVFVLGHPTVQAMLEFDRNVNAFYPVTAYRVVFDLPLAPVIAGMWPVAVCVIAGVTVLLRRGDSLRWLVGAWALVIAMVCLAAGPEFPLRMITGFWYTQSARVAAVYPVIAAPLAAVGLVALATWLVTDLQKRRAVRVAAAEGERGDGEEQTAVVGRNGWGSFTSVAAGLVLAALVVTAGWHVGIKTENFARAYVPGQIQWGTMASEEEIALLNRLPETTTPDALILGDPANGAAFAYSVADRHVVLPHLGESGMSADQALLRERFNEVGQDPAICEAVNRLGVTHFYQDTAGTEEGAKIDRFGPGLQQPMFGGLEVVDVGGTATLYRITACG